MNKLKRQDGSRWPVIEGQTPGKRGVDSLPELLRRSLVVSRTSLAVDWDRGRDGESPLPTVSEQ